MALREDEQAAAIAAEWGVDVELLEDSDWEIDSIDGNDGEVYGYLVRFADDTAPETLARLGLGSAVFERRVSINAFDEAEPDGPDEPGISRLGGTATFAGSSFAGNSFAVGDGAQRQPVEDDNEEYDGISSVEEPLPDISDFFDEEGDEELIPPTQRSNDDRRSYYIADSRYTPSRFRKLARGRKIQAMVQWFHDHYEDPAVRTPYESAEGGYQWIWGGPYDAREQFHDQFSDLAAADIIKAATQEVEKDGLVVWAPKERPEDYDQPDEPQFDFAGPVQGGSAGNNFRDANFSNLAFDPAALAGAARPGNELEALKSEMRERLDSLEVLIRQQMRFAANRGHNRPPELLEIERHIPQDRFQDVVAAITEIRQESESPTPQLIDIVEKASLFRRIAQFIKTGPGFVMGAAVSGIIGDAAVDAYKANQHQIYEALVLASNAVMAWVNHLLPF
ncbi:hypothetical protein [Rhizobium tumorigenes]|uniref:Uncharacterized protein n=1 Tax=Rhizobium tumorigenes TaxID=2041385 RepID=A0AAF1KWC4_9HYPH|nr:hypothetical protein [Rhizobium tumorigenes]WFR98351.1 hypothetical protein PR017_21755 [Rhizobium tumorigenes]WFS03866.1 hypothetical protein PR016_22225 [Rhizobium tumorigenes]